MNSGKTKNKGKQFKSSVTKNVKKTLHKNLDFTTTEQYKLIRANLEFTLSQDEKCPVIGVTSSMPGEGKSTTSINLAYVLSEAGKKVLLIDGDLRIPSIAKRLEIENEPGLTDWLKNRSAQQTDFQAPVLNELGLTDLLKNRSVQRIDFQAPVLENWYVLPSGDIPPNPSELLGSGRMKNVLTELKVIFDYIIIDLPPVNLVSDASSISPLISGMIVVVREEFTQRKELERCFSQLELSGSKILGCILNGVKDDNLFYGNKHKYKKYKRS